MHDISFAINILTSVLFDSNELEVELFLEPRHSAFGIYQVEITLKYEARYPEQGADIININNSGQYVYSKADVMHIVDDVLQVIQ